MISDTEEQPLPAQPAAEAAPADPVTIIERVGLAVGAVLLLYYAFRLFAFVHDDAFITYRYSWNLRHGLGPVFNPGEHTEGYSCPLYMLLTSLLMFLPGDTLVRAKLLGVAFALGGLWAAWKLARELDLPTWARAALPLVLGASSSVAFSAIDGMETSLQMLLVTMAAWAFVREQKRGRGVASAGWLLAAALNRPEGALFFLVALVPFFLEARRSGFGARERKWLALFLGPMALFFAWRLAYYHDPMPNTYYAKNVGLDVVIEKGPPYLLRTLFVNLNERLPEAGASILLWVAALGGISSDAIRRGGARPGERRYSAGLIVPLFVLAQALFALRTSGDWMQGWRYMMAVVPLWTLLLLAGLSEITGSLAQSGKRGAADAVGGAVTAVLLALCFWAAPEFQDPKEGAFSWAERGWATDARGLLRGYRMENTHVSADFLNKTLPPGAMVAYSEMGATPYFTPGIRWLDTYGLTDYEIAHNAGLKKFRTGVTGDFKDASTDLGRHILERKPDFVMQWIKGEGPASPILNGRYLPFANAPLRDFDGGGTMTLHVWKRAD